MSRIGKLGTGKAKTRSKAQYSQMGKARWEQYWREKDALQEARANGFTD